MPGDTETFPTPIANATVDGEPGGATIGSMKVVLRSSSSAVLRMTESATQSIAPGESKIFTPSLDVDPNAKAGQKFEVILHMVSPDAGIIPDPDSPASDTLLHFIVKRSCPVRKVASTQIDKPVKPENKFTENISSVPTHVESVQIGAPPPLDVRAPFFSPLDKRVTMRLKAASLRSYFAEVSRQTNLHFNIVPGLEQCVVSAFFRQLTAREALSALLTMKGVTYQQLGRSDTYTIAPRREGPICLRQEPIRKASGSCAVIKGVPISLQCKDGPLSSFAEIVYDQSAASFFVGNGAENRPTDLQFSGAKLDDVMNTLALDASLKVTQTGNRKLYLIIPAPSQR
jgi:hypothetical protein